MGFDAKQKSLNWKGKKAADEISADKKKIMFCLHIKKKKLDHITKVLNSTVLILRHIKTVDMRTSAWIWKNILH